MKFFLAGVLIRWRASVCCAVMKVLTRNYGGQHKSSRGAGVCCSLLYFYLSGVDLIVAGGGGDDRGGGRDDGGDVGKW